MGLRRFAPAILCVGLVGAFVRVPSLPLLATGRLRDAPRCAYHRNLRETLLKNFGAALVSVSLIASPVSLSITGNICPASLVTVVRQDAHALTEEQSLVVRISTLDKAIATLPHCNFFCAPVKGGRLAGGEQAIRRRNFQRNGQGGLG